jgi:hypothetical protein
MKNRPIIRVAKYFHSKNSLLGIFSRALEWIMVAYFSVIWNILKQFGMVILNIFWSFHIKFWYVLTRKSGNPARKNLRRKVDPVSR